MRKSLCLKVVCVISLVILGINAETPKKKVKRKGDWIRVPWSNGGHYWHNTVTREDRDLRPTNVEL
tara:strand:- start:7 stop:204 length:198 start_codon:yes stop_codon:yes gene_type:complete